MAHQKSWVEYLREAAGHYPDGQIAYMFDMETGREIERRGCTDTLALFIGREIESVHDETADEQEQRETIGRALGVAIGELERVKNAIETGGENA